MYCTMLNIPRRDTNRFRVRRRERASVVVLVIVALTLMAVLGAVYLQATRVQRFPVTKLEGDIKAVERATISLIQTKLEEDLAGTSDDPSKARVEPYDYPWTNPSNTGSNTFDTALFFGGTQNANGGDKDDMWLASNEPDFTNKTAAVWPHISNLVGHFLHTPSGIDQWDLSKVTDPSSTSDLREDVVNFNPNTNNYFTDTNVQLNNNGDNSTVNVLVDADGDGIGDSRWAWAPIMQINGVMYTMAVRIIDLSAKVNVNTAMSVGQDSGGNWAYANGAGNEDAPRWDTPSELDLGRFFWHYPDPPYTNYPQAPLDEIRDLINRRIGGAGVTPALGPLVTSANLLVSRGVRFDRTYIGASYWPDRGSHYADPDSNGIDDALMFDIANLHELLHANGINSSGNGSDLESITGGDTFNDYLVRGKPTNSLNDSNIQVSGRYPVEDYFTLNPRLQLTTLSGASLYAPRLPSENSQNPPLKVDLNAATATEIADTVERVYSYNTPTPLPFGCTSVQQLADQITADIVDYVDHYASAAPSTQNDGVLTKVGNQYGFEYLPQITEVYVQAKYQVASPSDVGTVDPVSGMYSLTWHLAGDIGYAIEIRNPYPFSEVRLDTVQLWVDGTRVGPGHISDIPGVPAGRTVLEPNEVLILYSDSDGNSETDDDVKVLVDTSDAAYTYIMADISGALTWGTINAAAPKDINVELRVETADETGASLGPATWPYATCASFDPQETIDQSWPDPALSGGTLPTPVITSYQQYWSIGNGEPLQMITVQVEGSDINDRSPNPTQTDPRDTTIDKLGEANKGALTGTLASPSQNQIIIANAPFWQVGELASMIFLPLDGTKTIAQAWNGATDVKSYQLDLTKTAPQMDATQELFKLPHAAFLLDRFTTLDLRHDGQDNDGDGVGIGATVDEDETMIPGLVNFNTVPLRVLKEILPIADDSLRDAVANAIVNYRERYRDNTARVNPGIAYLGELFTDDQAGGFTDCFFDAVQAYATSSPYSGNDTNTDGPDNTWVDSLDNYNPTLHPYPSATPPPQDSDGVVDDAEEKYMIAKWLAQVGSVRSDYFVAFVKIKGWNALDFSDTSVSESSQFLVVFRRSTEDNDHDGNGTVKIVGLLENNQLYRY